MTSVILVTIKAYYLSCETQSDSHFSLLRNYEVLILIVQSATILCGQGRWAKSFIIADRQTDRQTNNNCLYIKPTNTGTRVNK